MRPRHMPEPVHEPQAGAGREIGREIRALSNLIRRYMCSKLNAGYVDEATGTNGWIIMFLKQHENEDVFQRDLEKEFCVTRSTASKVLILMEQKGLVARKSVPQDGRLKKLVLTDRANELVELMKADKKIIESRLTEGFTESELDTLYGFIERMKENIRRELK